MPEGVAEVGVVSVAAALPDSVSVQPVVSTQLAATVGSCLKVYSQEYSVCWYLGKCPEEIQTQWKINFPGFPVLLVVHATKATVHQVQSQKVPL